jgi:hypothetical protein
VGVTVDQVGLKQVTKIVPVIVPKATDTSDTSETFKGLSGDIAPNGYKGFGANPRQDWVQKKGGGRLRNPVLYPPELQGQETRKPYLLRVYSDIRRPIKL